MTPSLSMRPAHPPSVPNRVAEGGQAAGSRLLSDGSNIGLAAPRGLHHRGPVWRSPRAAQAGRTARFEPALARISRNARAADLARPAAAPAALLPAAAGARRAPGRPAGP